MKITRKSVLSGLTRTRELDITEAQYRLYKQGRLATSAFPHLSPDDQEFIDNGITTEELDNVLEEEDQTINNLL